MMKNTIKKAALMVVAGVTVVSVACAEDKPVKTEFGSETPEDWTTFEDWFNGDGVKTPVEPDNDKLTAIGGSWNPANGVWHTNDCGDRFTNETFGLEFATNFTFTGERNQTVTYGGLFYTTKAKFRYSYSSEEEEELPEIEEGAKVGAVVCDNKYWVLGKNGSENKNKWTDTGISADVDSDVEISISLTNNASETFATYKFGTSEYNTEIVAADTALQTVRYAGCGKITTLNSKAGDYYPLYGVARGVSIANARAWAKKYGIDSVSTVHDVKDDTNLHDLLNSTTVTANGLTPGECCLIGINTGAVVTSSIDDKQVLASKLEFSMPSVSGLVSRAEFILKKDVGVAGGTETAMTQQVDRVFRPDFAYGIYTIHAHIDGGRPNNEPQFGRKMGVKDVADANLANSGSGAFCEVPYEAYAEDDPIAIADIFKKAFLVNGDQIDLFDSGTETWQTFTYVGDGISGRWQGVDKSTGDAPDPANTKIQRGRAFKFTRPNGSLPRTPVFLGYVTTNAAPVTVPNMNYQLVAMTDSSPYARSLFPLSKLASTGKAFYITRHKAENGAPNEIYGQLRGKWFKTEYYEDGSQKTAYIDTDTAMIEGPFFVLGSGNAEEVDFNGGQN